jgi:hypothetical protein
LESDETKLRISCSVDEPILGGLGSVSGVEADELLHSGVDVSLDDFSGVLSSVVGVQVMTKTPEFLSVCINTDKFPTGSRNE